MLTFFITHIYEYLRWPTWNWIFNMTWMCIVLKCILRSRGSPHPQRRWGSADGLVGLWFPSFPCDSNRRTFVSYCKLSDMTSRCWRQWVSSGHPLILIVAANSFHCASSCEMSVSWHPPVTLCYYLASLSLCSHTPLLTLLIQEREWTVMHVWLLKVAAGFPDNTATGWVCSNG